MRTKLAVLFDLKPGKLYVFKRTKHIDTIIDQISFSIDGSRIVEVSHVSLGVPIVYLKNEMGEFFERAKFLLPSGMVGKITIMYMHELRNRFGIKLYEVL